MDLWPQPKNVNYSRYRGGDIEKTGERLFKWRNKRRLE